MRTGVLRNVLVLLVLTLHGASASADDSGGAREKKLDFEGTQVEGVNKSPLDSLRQLGDPNDLNRVRLYSLDKDFNPDNKSSIGELRYVE